MSRHGYTVCDDYFSRIRWRGQVMSATKGKRGQAFFRELVAALDAMPAKRLVAEALEENGEVCALGCLGKARGLPLGTLQPGRDEWGDLDWDWDALGEAFGIAPQLAREVMYMNDDQFGGTPERRWEQLRAWAARQIRPTAEEIEKGPDR